MLAELPEPKRTLLALKVAGFSYEGLRPKRPAPSNADRVGARVRGETRRPVCRGSVSVVGAAPSVAFTPGGTGRPMRAWRPRLAASVGQQRSRLALLVLVRSRRAAARRRALAFG
jgi:hypothetical protein